MLELRSADLQSGGYRLEIGTGNNRSLPVGCPQLPVNYICAPGRATKWPPSEGEAEQLMMEGRQMADNIVAARATPRPDGLLRVPLLGAETGPMVLPMAGGPAPPRAPAVAAAAGVAAPPGGAAVAGGGALGFATGDGTTVQEDIAALKEVLERLEQGRKSSSSSARDRKNDKAKKKSRGDRRHRRKRSSSSGSRS